MNKAAILAAFLGSSQAMSVNGHQRFISTQPSSFAEVTNMAAARAGSGVRARWVELPECSRFCNFLDTNGKVNLQTPLDGQPAGDYIPLRDDLANAIIATCKGPEPGYGPNACPAPTESPPAESGWVAKAPSTIYDPVWKTSTVIPDHEHQVQGAGVHSIAAGDDHQVAVINQTQQVVGPKGDFQQHWNWPYQKAPAQWDNDGPGGSNYTMNGGTEVQSTTSVGWNPPEPVNPVTATATLLQ